MLRQVVVALLLAAAGALAVLPLPTAAQQLPAGPLKLPGPSAGVATAAAEQGQLSMFSEPALPAVPADEPGAAAGGRRAVQAAALPPPTTAGVHAAPQPTVNPASRTLRQLDASSIAQLAEPLFLPSPGQRLPATTVIQLAAAGSPAAEPGSPAAALPGANVQLAVPAAELGAEAQGRRSLQAVASTAVAAATATAQLPASIVPRKHLVEAAEQASRVELPSPGRTPAQRHARPVSRSLGEQQQQVAGPLTLPGPGQRVSGAGQQLVNQQVAARASPSAERTSATNSQTSAESSAASDGQGASPQGGSTRRLLAAAPLVEALLQPEAAAAAPAAAAPAAEQAASPFVLVLPPAGIKAAPAAEPVPAAGQPPAAEAAATAAEQPPAAEVAATASEQPLPAAEAAGAAPEEQPFEPLFPGLPPSELSAAPEAEALLAAAAAEPATAEVPGLGSEADLLAQAELALSGPAANASVPAFPAAGTSTPAGAQPLQQAQAPPPGAQGSNFSSLISLLDPPATFQMPPLSPQQQENAPKLKQLRLGTGTVSVWRDVGNFGGTQMACGMGYLSNYFKDHFVSLPTTLYRSGELCGACVRMWCVDSVCTDALVRNASFMVTDSCKECAGNNILVSERGFANLTGVNINISPVLQIAWTFESCAPLIQGGIRMLASKNNGPTFLSYNFSNLRQLLRAVTIGGIPFTRTGYGAWELNSPGRDIAIPQSGAEIVLTSVDGQRISKRLRSLGSQDLGINFS